MLTLLNSLATGILDIITSIGSIFQFLINIVTSLISFLAHLPGYVAFAVRSVNVLPSEILPFAAAGISIYFVLRLINRSATQ